MNSNTSRINKVWNYPLTQENLRIIKYSVPKLERYLINSRKSQMNRGTMNLKAIARINYH